MDIKIDRLPLHPSIIHFNMASKVSISVVVVSWVLCVFMHSTNMFIAAFESSLEAKALRESGWWTHQSNETSLNHCDWNGITCNDAQIVSQMRSSRMGSSLCVLILKKRQQGLCCTGVAPATEPPMPKLEQIAQIDKKNSA